ncbi:hypothetical protein ABFY60_28040 [Lysinibacillus pakistanensis]|uniref:hypothetical protein n=1 Tax=Lysinibacillus pakistanensis TaxID=759811 RepID=UPI003D2A84CF
MKKVIIASCLSLSILGVSAAPIANAEELTGESPETIEVTPFIDWSGKAYLVTGAYTNVTSSNNIFSDSPLVTNVLGNKGSIKVRVMNEKGAQVGTVKTIAVGKSVKLDSIP